MTTPKDIENLLEFFQEVGITEISAARLAAGRSSLPSTVKISHAAEPESPLPQSIEANPSSPLPTKIVLPADAPSLFDSPQSESVEETLEAIRSDLGDCLRCKLAPLRKSIVFGSGSPHAALMFVGEAPGADEDLQGLPFVGRAGQLLTKIIEAIHLNREQVYICNVIKCRPPENRAPEHDEIDACEPFLIRQIQSVKPKVIVCLGSPAMQTLLKIKTGITQVRGQWLDYKGVKVMATFHPAYCLRWPDKKKEVWEDMKKVRDYLRFVKAL